jgi:hypothetical protein
MNIRDRLQRLERETAGAPSGPCDVCGYPHKQRIVVLGPNDEEPGWYKGPDQDRAPCPACGREPVVLAVKYDDDIETSWVL